MWPTFFILFAEGVESIFKQVKFIFWLVMKNNNFLYQVQRITSATKAELTVIAVIITGLLIGLTVNYFDPQRMTPEQKNQIIAVFDSLAIASEQEFSGPFPNEGFGNDKININRASVLQLRKIPGIGIKTAKGIIEYRKSSGTFSSASDIMNVRGIGKKKFELFKDYIEVK